MYYKIVKDGRVLDVLDRIVYVKYQKKHDILLLCDVKDAEAVLSSDGTCGWHIEGLYNFSPSPETVEIVEISKNEYAARKQLAGRTYNEIIDDYTLELLERGIL